MLLKNIGKKINQIILWMDGLPLYWLFPLLFAAVFAPFLVLGEGSVFDYHDQLDESMMNIVLTARHLGEGLQVLPEMMGGINASGLQPSGILFVPLFCILPEFWAFIVQYAVVFAVGFLGMYFCVKELTDSSILSIITAACFCMLPMYPIYGLSEMGIPLVLYSFLRLWKGKKPLASLLMVLLFGLTSHLVCTGYVVLGFWAMGLLISMLRKRRSGWLAVSWFLLMGVYVAENYRLFAELLLGQSTYESHRAEMVNYATPFWETVWDVFIHSSQHAPSLHRYLILPIFLSLITGMFFLKRMEKKTLERYYLARGGGSSWLELLYCMEFADGSRW